MCFLLQNIVFAYHQVKMNSLLCACQPSQFSPLDANFINSLILCSSTRTFSELMTCASHILVIFEKCDIKLLYALSFKCLV